MSEKTDKFIDQFPQPWDLEPHYGQAVQNLTAHDLHEKSDIAHYIAALNHRIAEQNKKYEALYNDWDQLLEQRDTLRAVLVQVRESVRMRSYAHAERVLDAALEASK
jgi:hypothetical protein